jgi:putative aldouronate transport system permease protein
MTLSTTTSSEILLKPSLWQRIGTSAWNDKFQRTASMLFMGLPAIAFIFVFKYLTLFGVMIAFQRYRTADGVFGSQFIGLKNFEFLFKTPQIWVALRNTLFYNFLFITLGTMAALLIAFLIYEVYSTTFARFYQTTMFLPSFISWVVVSYFLIALLNVDDGLLNQWLASMGMTKTDWFRTPEAWPYIFVVISIWKGAGGGSLLYLATMLGID